jgi:ankyrin repeat protein
VFHIIAEAADELDELPDHELLRQLIACGANPNQADAYGNVPLDEAAVNGDLEAVALLIEIGADVALTDLNVEELKEALALDGYDEAAQLLTAKTKKPAKGKRAKAPANRPD